MMDRHDARAFTLRWADALESGDYPQIRGPYRSTNGWGGEVTGYCAVAVAMHLLTVEQPENYAWPTRGSGMFYMHGQPTYGNLNAIGRLVGPYSNAIHTAQLANDGTEATQPQIAAMIRAEVARVDARDGYVPPIDENTLVEVFIGPTLRSKVPVLVPALLAVVGTALVQFLL